MFQDKHTLCGPYPIHTVENVAVLNVLLAVDAEQMEKKTNSLKTVLHAAVINGRSIEVVEELRAKGANVNAKDKVRNN